MATLEQPAISLSTRLADRCVQRLNLRPPIDVQAVARACGIPVLIQPTSADRIDAMLTYYPRSDKWAIFVDGQCQDRRRGRFSIAHELGHYLLHRELIKRGDPLDYPHFEQEANAFAGELLMPAAEIQSAYRYSPGTLDLYFGVTWSAINWRLRQLGYKVW